MIVTQARYAELHGVSRKTVTVWKAEGRLVLDARGFVEVEQSDAGLKDAVLGRYGRAARDPTVSADPPPVAPLPLLADVEPEPPPPPPPAPEIELADPASVDAFLTGLLRGEYVSQAEAERIKENALAGIRALELRSKAGAVVDLDVAEGLFFEQARADRNAWMDWPSRIGPRLAAEFDVPADKLTEALTRHVHAELDGRGEPAPDFGGETGEG